MWKPALEDQNNMSATLSDDTKSTHQKIQPLFATQQWHGKQMCVRPTQFYLCDKSHS